MARSRVVILLGSDSDWETMEGCYKQLRDLGIEPDVEVMSAHRSPEKVHEFARTALQDGVQVVIAAAGMAAALAGCVAAVTSLPVIGVPIESGALRGVDALLSTVQMPPGVPVAAVGIGKAGAINAAVLAAQIIALNDDTIGAAMKKHKRNLVESVDKRSQALRERLKRD